MNKKLLLAALFAVFSVAGSTQQLVNPSQVTGGNGQPLNAIPSLVSGSVSPLSPTGSSPAASGDRAACTDKVTYVDHHDNGGQRLEVLIGGTEGWQAGMQSFPAFTGELLGFDFVAKSAKPSGSSTVFIVVYSIDQTYLYPETLIGSGSTTISNQNTYTVNFNSPINVSNGFCIALFSEETDSSIIYTNGAGSGQSTSGYSIVYHEEVFMRKLILMGQNVDFLVKPSIRFNYPNPSLSVSGPTTICGGTQVSATLTPPTSMNHFSHPVFNPNGQAHAINFGDGSAAYTSTSANHTYHNAGSYTISASSTYRGWNSNCTSNAPSSVNMTVNPATTSFFSWQANGLFVQFNNLSTSATGYSWNFGDGGTSAAASPVRTYASDGTYTVELTANGSCGNDLYYSNITVAQGQNGGDVSVTEEGAALHLNIFPNPTTDRLQLAFELSKATNLNVDLMNPSGQLISSQQQNAALKGKFDFDLSGLATGVYFVRISYDNEVIVKPVSKL